jgi:hypothetical protein
MVDDKKSEHPWCSDFFMGECRGWLQKMAGDVEVAAILQATTRGGAVRQETGLILLGSGNLAMSLTQ